MSSLEFIYVSFFMTLLSFVGGAVLSWMIKDHVEAFIDNAAYAKSITHPEMIDVDGQVLRDELLYLHITDDDDMMEEEDD
jgi:hypothetical protein